MSTSTDRSVKVAISDDLARALWAAMHDDDGLVEHYVELCILHGLTHFMEGPWLVRLQGRQQRELVNQHQAARDRLLTSEEDFADRWMDYDDIPF